MDQWLQRQRHTAQFVRAWYTYNEEARQRDDASGRRLTADDVYALCQLTWITRGDNTRAVIAPALSQLFGAKIVAHDRAALRHSLLANLVPRKFITYAREPLGFVNYYGGFRNIARKWLADNLVVVRRMLATVAKATSNDVVREEYAKLATLPLLPRPKAGDGKPESLLTPLLACLDPRGRTPIINERTRALLGRLGLASSTLVEQYDGLVFLIESGELEDAFALDRAKPETVIKKGRKQLAHYEDRDLKYLRELNVTRVRRLHNTMTNRLREICSAHGLRVEQGQRLDCRYDAMIREYRPGRDLLIEAKTDNSMPMVRMAIGQLYDYHRKLPEHDRVDCAVLLPTAPTSEQRGLLAHADIKAIWFDKRMKRIDGDAEIPAKKS